jgi:hypothetical protein
MLHVKSRKLLKIVTKNFQWKTPLRKPRGTCDKNVKVNFEETSFEGVAFVNLILWRKNCHENSHFINDAEFPD